MMTMKAVEKEDVEATDVADEKVGFPHDGKESGLQE